MIGAVIKTFIVLITTVLMFGAVGFVMDIGNDYYTENYQGQLGDGYDSIINFIYNNIYMVIPILVILQLIIYNFVYVEYTKQ